MRKATYNDAVDNTTETDTDVVCYGVNRRFFCEHSFAIHAEEIYFNGYTIINNVLDNNLVKNLSVTIDKIYKLQIEELGGETIAQSIDDENIVRCPLAYDVIFANLAKHPKIIELAKVVLGKHFVLIMQNAILNPPNEGNQQRLWHRDVNYQHFTSSKSLALNALFTIDHFSEETGCTHVLPGSHLREEFPTDTFIRKHETPLIAPPGSLILMDAMLYHRAGKNSSGNTRRAINHVIGLPFMAQQIDIPEFAGTKLATDDFSKKYFGYCWHPPRSARDWRLNKALLKTELK